ncbi:palmitoyl-monogalactosyldiacylglycerol delta-7 desaturase [Forsythia ovata]|uniref:Palmitoyl-monogalactosyldiacylglycerol delta-7 desaturase n=1 Tax=Forsythia ovata TaxID=205694 RepID=A0ABD1PFR7_9LAMI
MGLEHVACEPFGLFLFGTPNGLYWAQILSQGNGAVISIIVDQPAGSDPILKARNWFVKKLRNKDLQCGKPNNVGDLEKQPFYKFLESTYLIHPIGLGALLYALGGFPYFVWGMGVRTVYVYHGTWLVNSASHTWGKQTWNTGDLSKNNWWVAMITFGEGWHNNHHAFEYSARHGLEWWQIDITWYVIRLLEAIGLATDVKLPTSAQKQRMAFNKFLEAIGLATDVYLCPKAKDGLTQLMVRQKVINPQSRLYSEEERQIILLFIHQLRNCFEITLFVSSFISNENLSKVTLQGVRTVFVYHITWLVNSASHTWGKQAWNTGDLSRNNWWLAMITFGEGWHNNHHAFEYSARQGLEWWQIDITWYVIRLLEAIGLATDVKLPTSAQKQRMAFNK